ncbi:SemiSWEET transporter [Flavobacteriaceae bacterium]|mgnify:FL=1|jgi:MtN3 and saliva related transmembrane protein|nr:SemiSWEET transporter [Flavobacteriaceae bacterium]MDA9892662.1 SemiSWEET transporter [Flavobacteriaceae bacterium]MDB2342257.1 SemiSWEET transporter [Flavobacteriaceae bacterium]MDC0874255.1 SemiSWEET transporter [Flavobacteriaceae bacterium]MDC1056553.1 SemiSWEET transporter [Flavobacteriaceae bacterium]
MTQFEIELVGMFAAVLTTAAFVPQVYKIWKSKVSDGISLSMYLSMFIGVVTWCVYGYLIGSPSVMIANIVAGLLQLTIIYFKLKFR